MPRQGTATMPLHRGSAPRWLFDRMVDLGEVIAEAVLREYGRAELLRRLADPYWFQALGCVLGFDWHSSGVTTTTMGALKEALSPADHGVVVAGGKGATSRRTPEELRAAPLGLGGNATDALADHSRLSATVDNACVQDSYTLYHHTMVVTEDGDWAVVQQGMNDETARRYHWLSESVEDFVVEPQAAIASQQRRERVLDMTAGESQAAREVAVDLVQDDPARLKRYVRSPDQTAISDFGGGCGGRPGDGPAPGAPEHGRSLHMPDHHELRLSDLTERSIDQLECAYEYQPDDFAELAGLEGVGKGSLRALALIAELVHGAGSAREDPAKYAYAHGGKDGTPHPVKRERYDRSIESMRAILEGAEVDGETRQSALDRLSELVAE